MTEITGFFQKLLQPTKKGSIFRKCLCCEDILSTENFKNKQDFLKHFPDGHTVPFEDKPIEIVKTRNITKYKISVSKHAEYYNFGNAHGFLIENIQPSLHENLIPILSTRYWSTEPYQTRYFSDYIFYSLNKNILKTVIMNGMSVSPW